MSDFHIPTPIDPHDWRSRMSVISELTLEMSAQTDPQEMIQAVNSKMRQLLPADRFIAVSRRGLEPPQYRITRASFWENQVDPWKYPQRLPLFSGGLLAELIYGNEMRVINDLQISADDPAAEFFGEHQSLMVIPILERNGAQNMLVTMRLAPDGFTNDELPDWALIVNLFGKATNNLVLNRQLQEAYALLDRELQIVSEIQESLLPAALPVIPNMQVATFYQTSHHAGGDYYDFSLTPTTSGAF